MPRALASPLCLPLALTIATLLSACATASGPGFTPKTAVASQCTATCGQEKASCKAPATACERTAASCMANCRELEMLNRGR